MPYNKGFRVFPLKYIVSNTSISGSTYENDDPTSGKVINSNGTFGYTDDKYGVKRCLEDFCAPLFSTDLNGEGWQLDLDLCPDREAVILQPNYRVYALFFKHTTGARLMLGLNYFGMVSMANVNPSVDPPVYTDSSNRFYDIGFLAKYTNTLYPTTDPSGTSTTNSNTVYAGGLFMSMIPPANEGDEQDVFHPEISIRDMAFYPQTMTPIQFQKGFRTSHRAVSGDDSLAYCTSFIKQGTNDSSTDLADSYTKAWQYGAVIGKTVKLSLLVCEEVVGFTGYYMDRMIGSQLCGRILSDCRQPDDTLCTAEYAELSFYAGVYYNGSGNYVDDYLWNVGNSNFQISRCCNTTGTDWPNIRPTYDTNGYVNSSLTSEYIYAGYVYGYNNTKLVSPNGQTKAKLRSDLFRFTEDDSNKISGQTYNDNTWCYFYAASYSSATGSSIYDASTTKGIFIKWDGAFNGTNTFSLL